MLTALATKLLIGEDLEAAAKRRERERGPLLSPLKLFGAARVWEKGPRGEAMEATEGFEANALGFKAIIEEAEHAISTALSLSLSVFLSRSPVLDVCCG